MSWCSAAAPFKGARQNKYSVQASTSPVLDLAWPALESMTWNICSLLQQLFQKLPEFCAWWVIKDESSGADFWKLLKQLLQEWTNIPGHWLQSRPGHCGQVLPAFSNFQFLPLTRKPSVQSSWNRKLTNFDFWIFFDENFFFEIFFLVIFSKISDSLDSFCSNMSYY